MEKLEEFRSLTVGGFKSLRVSGFGFRVSGFEFLVFWVLE